MHLRAVIPINRVNLYYFLKLGDFELLTAAFREETRSDVKFETRILNGSSPFKVITLSYIIGYCNLIGACLQQA
jgi:hypothetical protein